MEKVFEEEKAYLNYTQEQLSNSIATQEKEMLEIPKRYNNVLQGDTFLVEDLMSSAATKLYVLKLSRDCPYFGRIDFCSKGSAKPTKIYIGKTTVMDNGKQVITDWRSPICSLYYDGEIGDVSYESISGKVEGELQLKRQIIIRNGELVEAFDTGLVSDDDLIQPYLKVNADDKMKTIIASIQKEQNVIIRKPFIDNIIVQGVAGSGKTSVALHRIAYLLYNFKDKIKSNQFLIIGPNKYFLDYISTILPELDTESVSQQTYFNLIVNCLGEKISLEKVDNKKESFAEQFKTSIEYKNALDAFINEYINFGIVDNGFCIDGEEVFSADEIRKRIISTFNKLPNYEIAYTYFVEKFKNDIDDIYEKLNAKYRSIYMSLPKTDPNRRIAIEKSTELNKLLREKGTKLLKDYFTKLKLRSTDIYKIFILNAEKYLPNLSEAEIQQLQQETLGTLKKRKVSFNDLPALMHIQHLIYGTNLDYKNVVIDEAQDYGLFHFYALKEVLPYSCFSIYGDLAQSINSCGQIKDWHDVIDKIFNGNCELLNLKKSYRTTIQITENANKILQQLNLSLAEPVIRKGQDVSFSESSKDIDYKVSKIAEWTEKGYKSIAIICKDDKEANKVFNELKDKNINANRITDENSQYSGGISVLTCKQSKGLEFDAVMLNDASTNMYSINSKEDMHLLYVACTRALHELDILYSKKPCEIFAQYTTNNLSNNNQKIKTKK